MGVGDGGEGESWGWGRSWGVEDASIGQWFGQSIALQSYRFCVRIRPISVLNTNIIWMVSLTLFKKLVSLLLFRKLVSIDIV